MTRGGHDAQSTGKGEASETDDREQGDDKFEGQKGEHGAFSGRSESHTFAGFLFDLDGTIINTTDAVTRHWNKSVLALSLVGTSMSSHSTVNTDSVA